MRNATAVALKIRVAVVALFFVFPYGNSLLSLNKKKVGME